MYLTIALIVTTFIISYQGLKKEYIREKYAFNIHRIQVNKEYIRFVSSGFFHVSWIHLIMNMVVLFMFGSGIEKWGLLPLPIIYFSSMIGGNLLAWLIHQHNPYYTSVGASGAISGLVFATIAVEPSISFFFFIPAWLFGIGYVLLTIYAIRSQRTDVGHAAHLGGALIGMCAAILLFPQILMPNLLPIMCILVPGIALIVIMIYKPDLILIDKKEQRKYLEYEDRYNMSKAEKKKEIDRILEKINDRGMNSLTKKEREMLEEYSKS
jgi:membrane associated rhomboid family serine protease